MKICRTSVILLALGLVFQFGLPVQSAGVGKAEVKLKATELFKQYLGMKLTPDRTERLNVLERLGKVPDALQVMKKACPSIASPEQRAEIAEIIGRYIQTPAGADVLTGWLKDPDASVRSRVVGGLRQMARRMDRMGWARIQYGIDHPPKVEGLVPALIKAANDSDTQVRVGALLALADTREQPAVEEIRKHLNDADAEIRLNAACLLTEYQDASGLSEMLRVLDQLRVSEPALDSGSRHYSEAEMLWASLERITGKSMGKIPLNPFLSSGSSDAIKSLREGYKNGLESWHIFFESAEGKQLVQKLMKASPAKTNS
jgi:hypothetical protein